ncbi:MAG TPA: glycoside hydrolase family 125 protein [bacterium]|nr:glycoside hydrolase family 125 protein [bacterium]
MKKRYYPTGNEYVSLPTISGEDASLENLNLAHWGLNGLISFSGKSQALVTPRLFLDDAEVLFPGQLTWDRDGDWMPRFSFKDEQMEMEGSFFCPVGERGFVLSMKVKNLSAKPVYCVLGAETAWGEMLHHIHLTKSLGGQRVLVAKSWEETPVLEWRSPQPLAALALYPPDKSSRFFYRLGKKALAPQEREVPLPEGETLTLQWLQSKDIKPNQYWETFFYFGLGPEEVAAFGSAREMQRAGGAALRDRTRAWLKARRLAMKDAELEPLVNQNAFFNRFYATAVAVDTEEVMAMTSRSPRYYVSGAYWDRDTLLWSFPALLAQDADWAGKVLAAVFARQGKHFGTHSRTLQGAVLEPGFELDELCAAPIALRQYLAHTRDFAFLSKPGVGEALAQFEKTLAAKRHPKAALYETWLLPSDDPWPQRYVTYDNVLVWRALLDLAEIRKSQKDKKAFWRLRALAEETRKAILRKCVVKGPQGRQFAWSVDLNKNFLLYDEPPGSLLLLPHWGFCKPSFPAWKKTRDWVYSPDYLYSFKGKPFEEVGCRHAAHPWVLAAVNSLLAGQKDRALHFLKRASMDNGLACESVDENTGEAATGEAFATCAGFLAYGLWHVMGKKQKKKR